MIVCCSICIVGYLVHRVLYTLVYRVIQGITMAMAYKGRSTLYIALGMTSSL